MIDLDVLIQNTCEAAPFSVSAARLAQLLMDPDYNFSEVIDIIRYDSVLTLRLLSAANSAVHAGHERVNTVNEALLRLGTGQILALAVATGIRPFFNAKSPVYVANEGDLWRHSIAAAVAAETSQAFCSLALPPHVFTAALMHDIGKLTIRRFLPAAQLEALAKAIREDQVPRLEAETLIVGVNHAELGGMVAKQWQLPDPIVQGIAFHHDPLGGNDLSCDFVYFANQVAKQIEAGLDGGAYNFLELYKDKLSDLPAVVRRIGMTPSRLNELCPVASAQFEKISQRYNAS